MTVRGVSNNPTSPLYNVNAPNLTGQTGSLAAIFDAVLVNGFTGFTNLGWTIAYSTSTTKRNYQMASGGTGASFYLDDSGPGAGTFKEARFNGFKTSTASGTGTGQFPTTSQQSTTPSGALVIRKSNTADGTVRYWTMIGDGHTWYFITEPGDVITPFTSCCAAFGDFFSYYASDTNNCMIIGRVTENQANYLNGNSANAGWGSQTRTNINETFNMVTGVSAWLTDVFYGHYFMGGYTGVGGSIQFGKSIDLLKTGAQAQNTPQMGLAQSGPSNQSTSWTTAFPYPNAADSGLYTSPVWVHQNGVLRGYLKGVWCPLQHLPLQHNDSYAGTGNLSGKSFIAQMLLAQGNNNTAGNNTQSQCHFEYSDTWN